MRGSPLAKCRLFVHKTVRDTRHWGRASQTRTNRSGPQCGHPSPAHLWFHLSSAQVVTDSAHPDPNQGAGGSALACGRAPPLCFSALPAIWATPSFWLLHCAKCFSALPPSAQGSPRPEQDAQATRSFWGSPLTPGMPPVWTTLSTKQMGLIQSSCKDPDLQDPGSHCPTSRAPHVNQLHHYCTCPVCAGGRGCLFNKPRPTSWASPRERSLWLTPRPGCCHPSLLYPLPSIEELCMLGPSA